MCNSFNDRIAKELKSSTFKARFNSFALNKLPICSGNFNEQNAGEEEREMNFFDSPGFFKNSNCFALKLSFCFFASTFP